MNISESPKVASRRFGENVPMKMCDDECTVEGKKIKYTWHHVCFSFARTIHKAQGGTYGPTVLMVGASSITFEMFLVACTRVRVSDDFRIMPLPSVGDSWMERLVGLERNKEIREWFEGKFDSNGFRHYDVEREPPKKQPGKSAPPAKKPRAKTSIKTPDKPKKKQRPESAPKPHENQQANANPQQHQPQAPNPQRLNIHFRVAVQGEIDPLSAAELIGEIQRYGRYISESCIPLVLTNIIGAGGTEAIWTLRYTLGEGPDVALQSIPEPERLCSRVSWLLYCGHIVAVYASYERKSLEIYESLKGYVEVKDGMGDDELGRILHHRSERDKGVSAMVGSLAALWSVENETIAIEEVDCEQQNECKCCMVTINRMLSILAPHLGVVFDRPSLCEAVKHISSAAFA